MAKTQPINIAQVVNIGQLVSLSFGKAQTQILLDFVASNKNVALAIYDLYTKEKIKYKALKPMLVKVFNKPVSKSYFSKLLKAGESYSKYPQLQDIKCIEKMATLARIKDPILQLKYIEHIGMGRKDFVQLVLKELNRHDS